MIPVHESLRPGPGISAYVPCFNNAGTLRRAVEGVLAQTLPLDEIVVIDDGSTDNSVARVSDLPVRVVRHECNLGRGAARARAMREVRGEFVLCCDATNVLQPDFTAKAWRWFDDPQVAAVFGVFRQAAALTVAERWRGRHLFKLDVLREPRADAPLATSGAVVRRSAVEMVGGFDSALRHTEDADLGERLLRAGYAVVCDPSIGFESVANNTASQVLERYWRWHAGIDEGTSWHGYAKNVGYAVKVMVASDLRARDPAAALISLACPHYQFWKSRWRQRGSARPRA
jgi:glycosyltransferase involved in cell wall biosynthesis